MVRSALACTGLLVIASALGGCAALRSLAGRNTQSLEHAEVLGMSVDLRKTEKTICPREAIQMAVFAEVVLSGERAPKQLETWQGGPDANRNGKLEFDEFAFHSEQGKFDELGYFHPNPDVLASVSEPFALTTAFRRRPDKFTFQTTYKPDYRCISRVGGDGDGGVAGIAGVVGASGESGSGGSSTSAGSSGRDGQPGGNGSSGGDGAGGPRLTVYATLVKTAFYDRLIAVSVEGSARDFVLLHPDATLTVVARGGDGGPGGSGGRGGDGGQGGSGNPPGSGGRGAQGGVGGSGGRGGPGGTVELIVDERFAELLERVRVDVDGGRAGLPGEAGQGGRAGRGGSGLGGAASAADGSEGATGQAGSPGSEGPRGSTTRRAGDVGARFAGVAGITVLDP